MKGRARSFKNRACSRKHFLSLEGVPATRKKGAGGTREARPRRMVLIYEVLDDGMIEEVPRLPRDRRASGMSSAP